MKRKTVTTRARKVLQSVCLPLFAGLLFHLALASIQNLLYANPQPGNHERTLTVDGRKRSCVVHIPPAYDGRRPVSLVIVLHGGGGNAENAMKMTGMNDKADEEGFIAAYPNGSGRLRGHLLTWNAGSCCGYALDRDIDDVGFISVLIDKLENEFNIDARRIYATGISNGGMMAYRLACELSDKLAAIAPVAGSFSEENCRPAYPVSVVAFHGTDDQNILYEGGKPRRQIDKHQRVDMPVSAAISFWVEHDRCSTVPDNFDGKGFKRAAYTGGRDNTEVVLYTIPGGGHSWPGGKKGTPWGDKPTRSISATNAMWNFFEQHPKGTEAGSR